MQLAALSSASLSAATSTALSLLGVRSTWLGAAGGWPDDALWPELLSSVDEDTLATAGVVALEVECQKVVHPPLEDEHLGLSLSYRSYRSGEREEALASAGVELSRVLIFGDLWIDP